jgi:hypothetical protein
MPDIEDSSISLTLYAVFLLVMEATKNDKRKLCSSVLLRYMVGETDSGSRGPPYMRSYHFPLNVSTFVLF